MVARETRKLPGLVSAPLRPPVGGWSRNRTMLVIVKE